MQTPRCIRCTEVMLSQHRYLHNAVTVDGNHDAKRVALDLDLLLILISGAPLNHAGRTQA
ncbi:hypothetical protein CQ006_00220 [Pseudomonas cedrina]|uniref:Uncharacterized protein n=1 Tax=Pseudomonas cedrina TaxID=651740 RepID=A0A2S9E7H1_PSECE|nr:hypothetical protein CLM72_16575 [Pseudomonas sp. MYb193]PRC10775.1 hypothetical protein CQ006_00220 [Pseudomonas cedrina]